MCGVPFTIFVYLGNGRLERAAYLYQILFETRIKAKKTINMLYTVEEFPQVQKWCGPCWICWTLGMSTESKTNENGSSVEELVLKNKSVTICTTPKTMGISFGSVQSIIQDNLNMWRIATKFMTHLLSGKLHLCLNSWLKTKCLSLHALPTHHT